MIVLWYSQIESLMSTTFKTFGVMQMVVCPVCMSVHNGVCILTLLLQSALPTCTCNTGFYQAANLLFTVTGELGREVTDRTFKSWRLRGVMHTGAASSVNSVMMSQRACPTAHVRRSFSWRMSREPRCQILNWIRAVGPVHKAHNIFQITLMMMIATPAGLVQREGAWLRCGCTQVQIWFSSPFSSKLWLMSNCLVTLPIYPPQVMQP